MAKITVTPAEAAKLRELREELLLVQEQMAEELHTGEGEHKGDLLARLKAIHAVESDIVDRIHKILGDGSSPEDG